MKPTAGTPVPLQAAQPQVSGTRLYLRQLLFNVRGYAACRAHSLDEDLRGDALGKEGFRRCAAATRSAVDFLD